MWSPMYVTPFQGSTILATCSQGVALGWYVTALQASEPCSLPVDLKYPALSQIELFFGSPSKWAKLGPSPENVLYSTQTLTRKIGKKEKKTEGS